MAKGGIESGQKQLQCKSAALDYGLKVFFISHSQQKSELPLTSLYLKVQFSAQNRAALPLPNRENDMHYASSKDCGIDKTGAGLMES